MKRLVLVGLLLHLVLVSARFDEQPENQVVNSGDMVSVTCISVGADSISWHYNNQLISPSSENGFTITGSPPNSSSLTISSAVHSLHHGEYECVVTQAGSTDVANFSIAVQYLDTFTTEIQIEDDPCYPSVLVGRNITLVCTPPSGYPEPTIDWYYDGNQLSQSDPGVEFKKDKKRLVLLNLASNDAGLYRCEATNVFGTESSGNYNLKVQDADQQDTAVTIVDDDETLYAKRGGDASINCNIIPTPDPANVKWTLGGDQIVSGEDGYILLFHSCLFTLRISGVSDEHEGEYYCRHTPDQEFKRRTLAIAKLNSAYHVTLSPSSPVGEGKTVQLSCLAMGEPGNVDAEVTYSWVFTPDGATTGSPLSDDGERVIVKQEEVGVGVLELRQLTVSDSGKYTCLAGHPLVNASVMAETELQVEARPDVRLQPNGTLQHKLSCDLTMICTSTSLHSPTFTWYFNGSPLPPSASSCGMGCSNLTVVSPTSSDLGLYMCTVNDDIHVSQSLTVEVEEASEVYFLGVKCNTTIVDKSFAVGQNVELECRIGGAAPAVANVMFVWFRGNEKLDNTVDRVTVTPEGEGTSMVVIESASWMMDEALYECHVQQETQETIVLVFDVFITVKAQITTYPDPTVEATEGERLQLECTATGRPTPTIMWVYRGETGDTFISNTTDGRVVTLSNGVLVIDPLRREDEGLYLCIAQQDDTNMGSKSVMLMVNGDPSSSDGFTIASLNEIETSLVIGVCGLAIVLLLFALLVVTISCCCCRRQQHRRKTYAITNTREHIAEFKREPSLRRDNSGVLTSTSSGNFFGLASANAYEMRYSPSSAQEPFVPPQTITHTPSYPLTSYGQEESIISDLSHSPSSPTRALPSPIPNNTVVSDSLFSVEDTSIAASLPNFPRVNLKLGEVMGEGEFGPVLLGVAKNILPHEEKSLVAVKVLLPRNDEEDHLWLDATLIDFANQMKLEHANISSIIGMSTDMEPLYVIYQYLDKGDLKKFLMSSRPQEGDLTILSQQNLQRIIWQVADGMTYLFSQRIIHGDLATRNCLISTDLRVKIADLGIGHDLYGGDYFDNGAQLLPIRWMPPELLINSEEGPQFSLYSDIWSFGVLCWEVFTFARLPYEDLDDEQVLEDVPNGLSLPVPAEGCPVSLYAVMQDCWRRAPDQRPHFSKLYSAIHSLELDR